MSRTAPLLEVFPSVQGEGLLAGVPQVFVRFGRCNIRCNYCDTPESIGEPPTRMEHVVWPAGRKDPVRRQLNNPLDVEKLVDLICTTAGASPACFQVSITGGEPLLHADFLVELLPVLRDEGLSVFLETNGLLAGALGKVASLLDVVSIDLKLPAETGAPLATLLRKHAEFLRVARPIPVRYAKIVVTADFVAEEVVALGRVLAEEDAAAPLFLTPVTPVPGGPKPPAFGELLALAGLLSDHVGDVRILPQVHPLVRWR